MSQDNDKGILGVSVFVAIVGVGLVVTSFATDKWFDVYMKGGRSNDTLSKNLTNYGSYSFGLFTGKADLDFGLGSTGRHLTFDIRCDLSEDVCGFINVGKYGQPSPISKRILEHKNSTDGIEDHGLYSFPWFVSTIVMFSLSMVFGLLAIGFSIFNIYGRPIETITGVAGLYVWNTLALIFTIIGISVYLGLFYSQIRTTVKSTHIFVTGTEKTQWQEDAEFDYSFFCTVGAAGAYIINLLLLVISANKCSCSYRKSGEKEMDNGMILY